MFGQITPLAVFLFGEVYTIILSINTKIFTIFTPARQAHP